MRTLVLDQGYQPHRVVSWQRGMSLLFRGKVDVLEEYESEIRTVSRVFRMPSVVRLRISIPHRRIRIRFSRQNVLRRDGFTCQYCGFEGRASELTIDHIVPRSSGGETTWTNVVAACRPCNQAKGSRPLARSGLTLRRAPTVPSWLPASPKMGALHEIPASWVAWTPTWEVALESGDKSGRMPTAR